MKQLRISSIVLFVFTLLFCFSEKSFAQAGGTNPELVMYRHNSGPGGAMPILANDHLGNLKWTGLTAIGFVRTGASIQSFTTSVSPGVLQANLIFRTAGTAPPDNSVLLRDRMIITQEGRVGIGTNLPQYNLHTVGNTHTSEDFYGRIHFDVGMPTNLPSDYVDEAYFERKNRVALGLAPNTYADGGILSLSPGGNSIDRQLFVGGNDGIWTRSQNLLGANSWDIWYKLLTSADISGRPNLVARFLPPDSPSSSLGEGQLFDNGSNVVIGSIPAGPNPVPVFDAANLLTVNGNTRITNNLNVLGNTGLGTAPSADRLDVSGTSRLMGNVGINTASNPAFSLDVSGNANFQNRVKIGAANFPTDMFYELAVGGGIMAEEVLVRLQPWPDYVFEKDYTLMPLQEVARFTQENGHLPGVSTAAEIAENGLNLGEMQKMQMEKIEELFLHLIALEKRINDLEKRNKALELENSKLKAGQEQH